MNLQFLGATGTVTGSKYAIRQEGRTVLVDCGLFQGYKQLRLRNWAPLPIEPAKIDGVILTHAHIDHSGYLPRLAKDGFRGRVYCSEATYELCRILLPDSGRLQEEEADYANRRGYSKHAPALPLYTGEDAERCLKLFAPQRFATPFAPSAGLNATLSCSGHMLGSSFVRLDDGRRSIVFSGDVGRPDDPILHAPERVERADYLVVESTYGDRLHDHSDPLDKLADVVNRTAARGGVIVIPAFAVGRAQALMYAFHRLKQAKRIHTGLPIFLNSPMAEDTRKVYHRHRAEHRLTPEQCDGMCSAATIVNTPQESRALNGRHGPMVIIAASGMATGGRVVHHLKAFASDHRNTILFAGYQAGGTRGAAILAGAPSIRIHGQDIPVRAEVTSIGSYSAHADAAEILAWLRGFAEAPRRTFVTHGEPGPADALRQRIERELRWSVSVPDYLDTVTLD